MSWIDLESTYAITIYVCICSMINSQILDATNKKSNIWNTIFFVILEFFFSVMRMKEIKVCKLLDK